MSAAMPAQPSYPRFSEIVRHFAPGWFAAVMGSGVLAITTLTLSARWPLLAPLAWSLHYFNLLLFGVLAVPWLGRWLAHRELALATLKHPVQVNFYPTFSIAMLVIAAQFLAFGGQVELALLFWWPAMVLTFVFSFAVLYAIFSGEHVGLEHVTPANFIPAVGLVVIPIAGAPLLGHLQGSARELALLANVVGLGAGSLMYLGLLALTLQRKYLAKPAFGPLGADGVDASRADRRHPAEPAEPCRAAAGGGARRHAALRQPAAVGLRRLVGSDGRNAHRRGMAARDAAFRAFLVGLHVSARSLCLGQLPARP
jgi:Tellurite resistance protein and related permeases